MQEIAPLCGTAAAESSHGEAGDGILICMWRSWCACLAVSLAVVACGGEPVTITLVFPSQDTFLLSKTAEITVYEAGEDVDPDNICRNLSIGQAAGAGSPIDTTGRIDVCALRSESVVIESVPVGRLVVFAEVQGGDVILMKGCRVADVYATGTNDIAITLATLPSYPDNPVITCATVDEKCVDGQLCTES